MRKRMKLRKKKKKKKFLYLIYVLIFFFFFVFVYYFSFKNINVTSNDTLINFLLKSGNSNVYSNEDIKTTFNNTLNYLFNIDITKPYTILNSSFNTFFNEEIILEHVDDYSNLESLEKISGYVEDPSPSVMENPVVYIYNTHQLENYNNKNLGTYDITPNVMMASYILREKLYNVGIESLVEDNNFTEVLNTNNWNYAASYKVSRIFLEDVKENFPNIRLFIDLHRDSVNYDITTTVVDGKSYARILFVVGLEHDNYQRNLSNATKFNEIVKSIIPSITRGIYQKSGGGVNGIYNQDISEFCFAIEIGGVDNSIEEVFNTIEVLAQAIKNYIEVIPNAE
ncbi:MAG: stage II sporulation protein P [bacterium]|nr:stage II sporulation protein P [bacterium]